MALVSRMVSDLTGVEGNEEDFTQLVVRQHPAISEPKALDVLPAELDGLKSAGDLVVLEIGSIGEKRQLVTTVADFKKVCPDSKLTEARSTRGRRPGYSPSK